VIDENNGHCNGETPYCVEGSCVECKYGYECSDGLYCNGIEQCNAGFCGQGVPPIVDDGVSCTIDSCDEEFNIIMLEVVSLILLHVNVVLIVIVMIKIRVLMMFVLIN